MDRSTIRRWTLSLVAAAAATMPLGAQAQVLVKPKVTASIIDPGPDADPGHGVDPACGQQLVPMMVPNAWDAAGGADSASTCANDLADRIIAAKYSNPSRLPDGMIRVWIFAWGNPTTNPNADLPAGAPDHTNWPTRIYRESDALPGLTQNQFPHPNDWTARPYLHPFLLNAGFGAGTGNLIPLKQWTIDFCQAFHARQAFELAEHRRVLPDPDAFWLDVEAAPIVAIGDINGAFLLQYLYDYEPDADHHHHIWNTWQVPGYPAGTTLASLYADAVSAYGFPETPVLDYNAGATAAAMRPYMHWFYRLGQSVCDHVVRICAIDVLKAQFPNCRVSSYGDSRTDGEVDTTGWFMKRPDDSTDPNDAYLASRTYPRAWMDPALGGWMWRMGTTAHEFRWLSLPGVASGDADAPYLYPLADCYWDPTSSDCTGYDWVYPQRQVNQYDRFHRLELLPHSSLRTHLVAVESQNNSGAGMHSDRLIPWAATAWTFSEAHASGPPPRNWVTPGVLMRENAMLRAHAVPEISYWTDEWDTRLHGQNYAFQAWLETSRSVRDVWADHISNVTVAYGTITPDTDNDRAARLEFTLRDALGHDRTIDIDSDSAAPGNTPAPNRTEMVVDFAGLTGCGSGDWTGILVNLRQMTIEQADHASQTIGMIMLWNWDTGHWHLAQWKDDYPNSATYSSYGCYTPPGPAHTFENRQSFEVYLGGGTFIENGILRMKLVNVNPQSFRIQHDLVQAIPFNMPLGGGLLPPLPISDKNYDNVVNSADLEEFLWEWLAGKSGADLNGDGVVDAADMALYLAAFIEES